MGHIERIDSSTQARKADRAVGVIQDGLHQRVVMLEKRPDGQGEMPWLVVRGLGDDVVWECAAPTLKGYVAQNIVCSRIPRTSCLMAVIGGFTAGGSGAEWRAVITDWVVARPVSPEEFAAGQR